MDYGEFSEGDGTPKCHFYGDALEIVQALNKAEGDCWTTYGQIVNDANDEIDKH